MATKISRRNLYWTAAGVVVATLTLVATMVSCSTPGDSGDNHSQNQSGTGNQQAGNGGIINNGNMTLSLEKFLAEVKGLTREDAERVAQKYVAVPPIAGQPAAFLVVDAPHGLWVRSSGTTDGYHVGAVTNGATVWVDCYSNTEFDPDHADNATAKWLRIRWSTSQPNDNLESSQPSGRFVGWVYWGHTVPAGHNGNVPDCSND